MLGLIAINAFDVISELSLFKIYKMVSDYATGMFTHYYDILQEFRSMICNAN